jgi:hypothetical protein
MNIKIMNNTKYKTVSTTVATFGVVMAIVISWSINNSISWAIIHGLFGWAYVIYYAIVRN